jgi:hypothetical protein
MKQILLLLLAVSFFLVPSCNKPVSTGGQNLQSDTFYDAANTAAQVEMYFDDPLTVLFQVGVSGNLFARTSQNQISACTNISILPADTVTYPKTITVNFGNGCIGEDGRERSGSIVGTLSEKLSTPGSMLTINLNNYAVGGVRISGTRSMSNISMTDTIRLNSEIRNGAVAYPTGQAVTYTDSLIIVEIPGSGAINPAETSFTLNGSGTMNVGYGDALSITIIQSLIQALGCKYFVAGQFSLHQDNKTAVVDFGTGTCSGVITISVYGQSAQTTLPE